MELFVNSPMLSSQFCHNNCKIFPVRQRTQQQELFFVDFTQSVRDKIELEKYIALYSTMLSMILS